MQHTDNQFRQWLRALLSLPAVFGLMMIGLVWAGLVLHLSKTEKGAIQAAKQNTDNLARAVEEHIVRSIEQADKMLLSLRAVYAKNPGQFNIENARIYLDDLILQVGVIGPDGILKTTTRARVPGERLDLSDQEHYRVHLNADKDDLFIGKPMNGKVTSKPSIPLSRRLSNPDGSFGGAIVVFIDRARLSRLYDSIDVGKDGTITVVGLDKVVRAARGFKTSNDSFKAVTLFEKVSESPTGFFAAHGNVDGIRRLISYRKIASLPLVVLVGLAQHEVFADYWRARTRYYTAAAALTAVILIIVGFGALRDRKLRAAKSEVIEAQEALSRANQELIEKQHAIDQAVIVGITDVKGLITYANDKFCRISGYAREELLGESHRILNSGFHSEKFFRDMYRQIVSGQVWRDELCNKAKDGSLYWVDTTIVPQLSLDGKPVAYMAIRIDITKRKQAQALIEESRKNLERGEAMTLLGHYKFYIVPNTITWSEGVYRIFGKSPGSFTPTLSTVIDCFHPDDRPVLEQYRHDIMAGLDLPSLVLRAIKADGQTIYVENCGRPLRASDDSVIGMFGTVQDITARKRAEEALARANEDLEARVAERTAELAQEMRRREEAQMTVAQTQKMEAVGQLTAGIAHDFNNLLAVIGGGLEFIKRAAARGVTADPELIDAAIRSTQRGADLVRGLLAFARQTPLKAEPTAVDQLVLDTLRLLQRTLGEGIEIVPRLDAAAATVSVDRSQLVSALLSLALNARDAMSEGGQLTIATTCNPAHWAAVEGSARWPTGEQVCITVSDTGVGMTEEVRNRVFEPFFTTKVDGLGTGLGLSMVQGFVQQSGGHIEIDSAEGHGTTIIICLPRIAAVSQPDETDAVAGPSATGKKKTVLLVEDDPDVRIVTAAQLKQLGYKVHAVANGMEAIDLIASPADIDIMLTDIVLPGGLDGVALVKEAIQARPRMGVLCMSGYDPTQSHRKWLKVQNIDFLEKPFSSGRLAQALEGAFAQ